MAALWFMYIKIIPFYRWIFWSCCCSVMSSSLQLHGPKHTRLPCPSLSPGVCSYSCPLNQWYHPTISSSVAPFSPCSQFFPASGSFPVSWLFTSGGQRIGVSASATVLPMNRTDCLISFRTDCFDLLAVQRTLKSLFSTTIQTINSSTLNLLFGPTHLIKRFF